MLHITRAVLRLTGSDVVLNTVEVARRMSQIGESQVVRSRVYTYHLDLVADLGEVLPVSGAESFYGDTLRNRKPKGSQRQRRSSGRRGGHEEHCEGVNSKRVVVVAVSNRRASSKEGVDPTCISPEKTAARVGRTMELVRTIVLCDVVKVLVDVRRREEACWRKDEARKDIESRRWSTGKEGGQSDLQGPSRCLAKLPTNRL